MATGKLEGKVAIVTGAASGIGQAVALRFAEEGARLVLADLNASDATLSQIVARGGEAMTVAVDTSSKDSCDAMVAAAVERFGRVDTGVFAAGIRQDPVSVLDLDLAALQKMLDINMMGVFHSARALARQLVAQGGGGTIVNLASTAGKIPIPGSGPYCMAKAAVIMLTKVMALELAELGIRVNALAPGFTSTPMWDPEKGSDEDLWAMSMTPMKRTGTPEEQAEACLFLASDRARNITGIELHVTAGQWI